MHALERSARGSYEARILSKSRYEPRVRATPRKRVVYEPRALSSVVERGEAGLRAHPFAIESNGGANRETERARGTGLRHTMVDAEHWLAVLPLEVRSRT